MVPCIAIGDGTALGVANARPECVALGAVGISAQAFVATYLTHLQPADTAIISLGASDAVGSDVEGSLMRIRHAVTAGKVVWLMPYARPAVRFAVAQVAAAWHDSVIDTSPAAARGVEPTSAKTLASQTKRRDLPAADKKESEAALLDCGSTVDPSTLQAIMRVESGAHVLAIKVNGATEQPLPAGSAADATAIATAWIAKGYDVDMGLMQVNSRNLQSLGYSVAQMFDPCTNIAAGASILTADYLLASVGRPDPQVTLRAALSAYNTGSFERGFFNGYVAKYYGPYAGRPVPIITASVVANHDPHVARPVSPFTASMVVYSREGKHE